MFIFLLELSSTALSLVIKMRKKRKDVRRKKGRNIIVENTSNTDMLEDKNEMEER